MTLSAQGFVRARLSEIKADYDQRFKDALGAVNTNADSVTGQIIGIFSAALDDVNETLQNVYDSMYPNTAEGAALDGAVSFVGLERIGAAPTVVTAMAYGTESTLIPTGSLARTLANAQFITTADTLISRANAGDVDIIVNTVANSTVYQIIAGGVSVSYTSDSNATESEILNGLKNLFSSDYSAVVSGSKLTLRKSDLASSFTLTLSSNLTIDKLGSPVSFTSVDLGAIDCSANTLTRIDTSLSGWTGLNNLVDGATGRDVETDTALRVRHRTSVRVAGAATLQAIKARILNDVASVTACQIFENRTHIVDGFGLPAHSFECIVSGGTNSAVAEKIYEVKPAGIETYGAISQTILDENGDGQLIRFSRPVTKYAWIKITVTSLNAEQILTTNAANVIKDAVVALGNAGEIGADIMLQKFYAAIFGSVQGVATATIEGAITTLSGDTPSYLSNYVGVGRTDLPVFDVSRVTVLGI